MNMLRSTLPLVLALGMASPAWAQSALTPRAPALLIHGNYCGPGNNAPLPPIDALDRACAHHDACTRTGGLPSAACNARLQREADAVARDPRQPEDLRSLAGFVALGATLLPSDPGVTAPRRDGGSSIAGARASRVTIPALPGIDDDEE